MKILYMKKWCMLPKSECPGTVPGESDRPAACQEVDFPHTASPRSATLARAVEAAQSEAGLHRHRPMRMGVAAALAHVMHGSS